MAVNSTEPALSSVILSYVCFYTLSDKYVNDIIIFDDHKVNRSFQCTQSQRRRKIVDFYCYTVAVAHSVMKWPLMNTKSTKGSDVQKIEDEGKMLIINVKPLLSLTLS